MKDSEYQEASEIVIFGALGDLSRRKLLPALYQLDQVGLLHPDSRIIAVARQEMPLAELIEFVKDELLDNRVHFLGRIPHEELPNYTQMADVGIVLEEPLGKSFEFSLPNKLFDYIHAELPIISGNLVEIKNIIETYNVGLVIENYLPKTIAKTIERLITDNELYQQIKEQQKKVKHQFCWEKEQQKLEKYFK